MAIAAIIVSLLASLIFGMTALPPNTSLAQLPVAYYGSSFPNKTSSVCEMLSKQRVVILVQQDGNIADGHCWELCCPPGNWDPVGRCQNWNPAHPQPLNASLNPGVLLCA